MRIYSHIEIVLFWVTFSQCEAEFICITLQRHLCLLRGAFKKCQMSYLLLLRRYKSRCIFRPKTFKSIWQFVHLLFDFKNLSCSFILGSLCKLDFLMNYFGFRHQRLDPFWWLALTHWFIMKQWKISISLVGFIIEKHHRSSHFSSFRSISSKS